MSDSRHPDCVECPFLSRTVGHDCPDDREGTSIPGRIDCDFEAGGSVFSQGDSIAGVYCVRSGSIVLTGTSGPEELTIAMVTPGDVVGMPEILGGNTHRNGATAREPTSTCFIPRENALELLRKDPSIMLRIMRRICERLRLMEDRVEG